MRNIAVRDWGIIPSDDRSSIIKVEALLNSVRETGNVTLEFEEGVYHFYPDFAKEKLLFISNHDEDTIKKIAFDLSDCSNVKVCGRNTQFIFHTEILPFYLHQCSNVSIEGISIDYARPGYSEGTILSLEPKKMVLSIDPEKYPYFIEQNRIYFIGENFCYELTFGLEMDGERWAPIYDGHDTFYNVGDGYTILWREAEKGIVEAILTEGDQTYAKTSKIGNKIILRHHPRNYPAIYVTDSKDISFSDVNIYHATGMGLIAQFTENIKLDHFNVTFNPVNKRVFTAAADATHFVYCRGLIHICGCLFENQLDDPVNIHGIYARVKEVLSETEVIVELVHHQQKGVKVGENGDRLGLVNNKTMLTYDEVLIEEVRRYNRDYSYIKFNRTVQHLERGHVVENVSYVPDVLIEDCIFRNNRARGLLLTSAGQVVVRNNHFKTAGAAILVEGDSALWFESGATKDITIESNIFEECSYVADWGYAPIQISPSAVQFVDGVRYHKYMNIRNNQFNCFDERIIKAKNIETIEFTGNTVQRTESFPPISGERFELQAVLNFIEEDNKYM